MSQIHRYTALSGARVEGVRIRLYVIARLAFSFRERVWYKNVMVAGERLRAEVSVGWLNNWKQPLFFSDANQRVLQWIRDFIAITWEVGLLRPD